MKIRTSKKQLGCSPRAIYYKGRFIGSWPDSGTWEGSRGQVIGHLLNWFRKFGGVQ